MSSQKAKSKRSKDNKENQLNKKIKQIERLSNPKSNLLNKKKVKKSLFLMIYQLLLFIFSPKTI